ncbi:MAG: hypothetical protein NVSMB42_16810 [Herpetosiphon sp.]
MARICAMVVLVGILIPAHGVSAEFRPQFQSRNLRELSPFAANVADYRQGWVGVAVYRLDTDDVYSFQGNRTFYMYSIVKVPIMLTVLDRAARERRHVSPREQSLIEAMIEYSDNSAATELIISIGGAPAVQDFLRRNHINDTRIDPEAWGASTTTAIDMARLMTRLGSCLMLVQRLCDYAIGVMQNVEAPQAWGITAGIGGASAALKNGWYPDDGGWGVNSIGIVQGGDKSYAIAVLTSPDPSFSYGVTTIEQISAATYSAMR